LWFIMRLKNNFRLQDFAFSLIVDIEEKTNLERFDIGSLIINWRGEDINLVDFLFSPEGLVCGEYWSVGDSNFIRRCRLWGTGGGSTSGQIGGISVPIRLTMKERYGGGILRGEVQELGF